MLLCWGIWKWMFLRIIFVCWSDVDRLLRIFCWMGLRVLLEKSSLKLWSCGFESLMLLKYFGILRIYFFLFLLIFCIFSIILNFPFKMPPFQLSLSCIFCHHHKSHHLKSGYNVWWSLNPPLKFFFFFNYFSPSIESQETMKWHLPKREQGKEKNRRLIAFPSKRIIITHTQEDRAGRA